MKTTKIISLFLFLAGNIFSQQFCDTELKQKITENISDSGGTYLKDFEYHPVKPNDTIKYSMVLSENTKYRFKISESEKYSGKVRFDLYDSENLIGTSCDTKTHQYHDGFDANINKSKVYHFYIYLNEGNEACGYIILYYLGPIQEVDQNNRQQQANPDQMAEFPGGMAKMQEFILQNFGYPSNAIKNNIQGKVFIKFVITEDGSVTDVKVARSLNKECDEAAVKVIKSMPKWNPGRKDGKNISMELTFPVEFKTIK